MHQELRSFALKTLITCTLSLPFTALADDSASIYADACEIYLGYNLQEFTLSDAACIDVDEKLSGMEVSIADSDANKGCDFRGTVSGSDGGNHVIDGNWESIAGDLAGNTLYFELANDCPHLKLRVRPL